MAILQFPYQKTPQSPIELVDLVRVDDPNDHGTPILVRDLERIHSGNSVVFRATLEHDEGPPEPVVCKLRYDGRFDRLRTEARMYQKLYNCQGDYVPVCFGLYEGMLGERAVSCLVLQYCGVPMGGTLLEASWHFKYEVMECLKHVHSQGVQHNDLDERNIVVHKKGLPLLIDFDHAMDHQCPSKLKIKFHEVEPPLGHFGCKEVHIAGKMMAIWIPRLIEYMGVHVDIKVAGTPEELAKQTPYPTPEDEALRRARIALAEYGNHLYWRSTLPLH
ncbi:hypothetical protein B0H21DRAFT_543011 [Amylocystis lapponica]|nr:hypothetical protein B0H21DRAFT_543011 [Amylocystis lapponica]